MTELRFPAPPLGDGAVLMREARPDDAAVKSSWGRDPEILRWTEVPADATEADILSWHEFTEEQRRVGRGLYLTIVGAESDEVLGACDLRIPGEDPGIGELGYLLGPDARGRGVASRALALLIGWGFEELGLARIQALVHPDNAASLRLLQRLGFHREGLLRAYRDNDGVREDRVIYSLLPDEPARSGG